MTSSYAVVNPATGETVREYPEISDEELRAAIGRADEASRSWPGSAGVAERAALVRKVGELHVRAAPAAGRDHRRRDGQADRAGARRGRLRGRDLRLLRGQRRGSDGRRADRAARRRRHRGDPPQPLRRPARDHALELPLLPGGPLRRAEPGDRQHDPAQARAAVPRIGRGDAADVRRRRLPRGRLREHLRDQRADRVGDRRPAPARRLGHRLRARRRGRRRDRRPQPEEGRARARRLGPLHPARQRRSRRRRRAGRRSAARQHRPVLQRRQALHRRRRALRRVPREVPREAGAPRSPATRPPRTPRSARSPRRRRPTGSRTRSSARSRTAPRSWSAASATATTSNRRS